MKKLLSAATIGAILLSANQFDLVKGWNLIGTNHNIEINNSKLNNPDIDIIWRYEKGEWYYFSNKIKTDKYKFTNIIPANKGAWVYSSNNITILENGQQNQNNLSPTDLNLTDEQKYAIAYMWNDEKMAHDLYLALYNKFPNQNVLYNIATKAESTHELTVENLAQAYDINITNYQNGYGEHYSQNDLDKYGAGEFFIPAVQQTYDTLYNQGSKSEIDALKVGCMVEVVDVDDLNKYLDVVKDKPDIVNAFENLRSGSYNHYWAFDTALKNLGVSNGCCSLGDEYCKTPEEFPTNNGNENKGNENGKGNGNGNKDNDNGNGNKGGKE